MAAPTHPTVEAPQVVIPGARHFRYRNDGSLVTIGRTAAVAQFGKLRLSGFPVWAVWLLAHIHFFIGCRKRLVMMLDWTWAYGTHQRHGRSSAAARSRTTISRPLAQSAGNGTHWCIRACSLRKRQRPGFPGRYWCQESLRARRGGSTHAANKPRIFFIAFASTWRIRSAETPYSSARSCNVALLSSFNQRRWMMSRERLSRRDNASVNDCN